MVLLYDDDDELIYYIIRYLGDNLLTCNLLRIVKYIGQGAFQLNNIKTVIFPAGYACIYVCIVLIVNFSSTIGRIRPKYFLSSGSRTSGIRLLPIIS